MCCAGKVHRFSCSLEVTGLVIRWCRISKVTSTLYTFIIDLFQVQTCKWKFLKREFILMCSFVKQLFLEQLCVGYILGVKGIAVNKIGIKSYLLMWEADSELRFVK